MQQKQGKQACALRAAAATTGTREGIEINSIWFHYQIATFKEINDRNDI